MKINKINNHAASSFAARYRANQNETRALPLIQPLQYGMLSQDKLLSTQDFLNLRGEDCIAPSSKTYDSFTGLRDKNYLMAVLNQAIKNSKTSKMGISVAMFDMDNFKSINELLGYEAGDNFIKIMSNGISNVSDDNEISAYRFGGDEFVLIFNGQSQDAKDGIVNGILSRFKANTYINSMADQYRDNAEQKLSDFTLSSSKIQEIMKLKAQKAILTDLIANFSPEAQEEPYLIQKLQETNSDLRSLYLELITDALNQENDEKRKNTLASHHKNISLGKQLSSLHQQALDEYLFAIYDKSAEIYQLKQWLKDYNRNDGFSFTASVVDFTPQMLTGKKPIGIINEVGESLKQGKSILKGQSYSSFSSF